MKFANYSEAKQALSIVEQLLNAANSKIKALREGRTSANGLALEELRLSPEYKSAKAEFAKHFEATCFINKYINKHFKKERLAEYRAKRA